MLKATFRMFVLCILCLIVSYIKAQTVDLTDIEKATIQNDVNFLTAGVSTIAVPSNLYQYDVRPFGKFAYAFANNSFVNVWSAARYGAGKICAFGSKNICQMDVDLLSKADNKRLMQNCIQWITNQTNGPAAQSPVGLITTPQAYNQGFTKSSKTIFDTSTDFEGIRFVLADEAFVQSKLNPARIEVLKSFVQHGGGLIICNRPLYKNSFETTTDNGNQLLLDFGLIWTSTFYYTLKITEIPVNNLSIAEFWKVNALYAAKEILKNGPVKSEACIEYMSKLMPNSLSAGKHPLNQQIANVINALAVYSRCCNFSDFIPVDKKMSPIKFSCVGGTHIMRSFLPLNYNHPIVKAAKIFPGYPTSTRANVTKSVTLLNYTKWQSTGFYVWPGSTLQVQVPKQLVNSGYNVQIDCHKENLLVSTVEKYNRWPIVADTVPITQQSFSYFTFIGGLLYLDVPTVASNNGKTVTITFTGELVPVPWFRLGVTKEGEWQDMVAANVSPWIEIESNLMIATINASYLTRTENITRVAMFKDQVLSLHYDLRGNSRNPYKERIISDIQSVHGSLFFAGYPVNGNSPYTEELILAYSDDVHIVNNYQSKLSKGLYWALFHEFGHNFQVKRWTPSNDGEVTCNIFSLYIEETFPDGPNQFGNADFHQQRQITNASDGLMFYLDLRAAFGWVAFKKFFRLFEANQTLTSLGSTPENDNWLKYFSQTVNRNINPLVTEFGRNVSADAIRFASKFPAWDKHKIIDCDNKAFSNSPCMSANVSADGSILFRMIAWAPINYTEALELKFVEATAPSKSGIVKFDSNRFWSSISYNGSTQTMRFIPLRRINNEDYIEFRLTKSPTVNTIAEIRAKIVNVATSKTIHLYERSLEVIR